MHEKSWVSMAESLFVIEALDLFFGNDCLPICFETDFKVDLVLPTEASPLSALLVDKDMKKFRKISKKLANHSFFS